MAANYEGTKADNGTINIPDDGDVADAESVNRAFRALKDALINVTEPIGNMPIHHTVPIRCFDYVNIVVGPLPQIITPANFFAPTKFRWCRLDAVTLTIANVRPAIAAWPSRKPFYIYLVYDNVADVFSFEISASIPDSRLAFQGVDPFRRYLGSFMTDAFNRVRRFSKVGHLFTFLDDNNGAVVQSLRQQIWQTADLKPFFPPHVSKVKLQLTAENSHNGHNDYLSVRAKLPGVLDFGRGIDAPVCPAGTPRMENTMETDIPVVPQELLIEWGMSFGPPPGGDGRGTIIAAGYYEG